VAKKNVLGSDPFEWLKKDDKKEDTENKKSDIGGQKKQEEKPSDQVVAKEETSVKQEVEKEVKQEAKAYGPIDVSVTPKPQVSKAYDKIIEPYLQQEEETFESSDISEANRKAVLGKDVYAHHAKSRKATQKDSPATAFVIVYTVLLLILGFIVYKDLTKQINKLETKLERVEKKLDEGAIDYEDTKLDGEW